MTIASMTGYGQAGEATELGLLSVEIRSVNHRHFDCVIRASKEFLAVEDDIRRQLKERVARGRLDVFISLQQADGTGVLAVNWPLLNQLKSVAEQLREKRFPVAEPTALEWLQFPGVLEPVKVDAEKLWLILSPLLEKASTDLAAMRQREGARLADNLQKKLTDMKAFTHVLEERAPEVQKALRSRLEARLEQAVQSWDENRLLGEIVILADKVAIDEEVTRLYSHIEEFSLSLRTDAPVGKRLDFISQEMNREVNTIASKSQDLLISQTVVEMKTAIEQLREQVQNIE